jgi:Tfp pilus assembly protein PilO
MKRNKKIKKLGVFFTIVILEMILVAGFIGYKGYLIGKNTKLLHSKTKVLEEKTTLALVANNLENQKKEKETLIENDKKAFFDDMSLMKFLRNLYNTALVYNLSINSISFNKLQDAANTNPPIKILPINLSITFDDYDNIVKFLAYLEKNKFSLKPDYISISNSSQLKESLPSVRKSSAASSISITIYVQTNSTEEWSYMSGGK